MSLPAACWAETEIDEAKCTSDGSKGEHDTVTGTVTATFAESDGAPRRIDMAAWAAGAPATARPEDTAARMSTFLNIAPPSGGIGTLATLEPSRARHIGQMPEIRGPRCPIFGASPTAACRRAWCR